MYNVVVEIFPDTLGVYLAKAKVLIQSKYMACMLIVKLSIKHLLLYKQIFHD